MKKLMLMLTACCLIFASCGKETQSAEPVQEETCCEMTAEEKAMCEAWQNWDNLAVEDQEQLVIDVKAWIDAKMAECPAKKAECEAKKAECEAKHAAFMEKWEKFDELTLEAKKELIEEFFANKCCKEKKEGCCKEKKEGCDKEQKEKCGKH